MPIYRKVIVVILALSALFCAAYMQSGIKPKPQIYFIGFSALTTIFLFSKVKVIPSLLFTLLIGGMLYLLFFSLCMFVIDLIAPDRAVGYLEDGRKVVYMDFTFVYAIIAGLILSLISVSRYARNRNKIGLKAYEKYFALTTLVVIALGYCMYEL